jgi:protein glucosyltransferase
MKREPYAYWKGNPAVAETRQDLMKCNVSEKEDWNARLYAQVYQSSFTSINCIYVT